MTFCFYSQLLAARLETHQQTCLWIVDIISMSCKSLYPIVWPHMSFSIVRIDYRIPISWYTLFQAFLSFLSLAFFNLWFAFVYWQDTEGKCYQNHYPRNELGRLLIVLGFFMWYHYCCLTLIVGNYCISLFDYSLY